MLRRLAAGREFGLLLLLVPVGLYRLYRRGQGPQAAFLATWIAVYFLFHLPLALTARYDNPTRFLLPMFPALACLIGYGLAGGRSRSSGRPNAAGALVLLLVVAGFGYQKVRNLPISLDFTPHSYGHLTERERAGYESFDALLPPNAVVVSDTSQSGAIQLYGRRPTVRPLRWSAQQFERFVKEARLRQWPLFVVARRMPAYVRTYNLTRAPGLRGRLFRLE